MSEGSMDARKRMEVTTEIVAAYVANNQLPHADLPALVGMVHAALSSLDGTAVSEATKPGLVPAVPVKRSVTPEAITCLSCGKRFKTLKRHLMADHDLTPRDYRELWSLPHDYPMVAANFAEQRSEMAVRLQLGRRRG